MGRGGGWWLMVFIMGFIPMLSLNFIKDKIFESFQLYRGVVAVWPGGFIMGGGAVYNVFF